MSTETQVPEARPRVMVRIVSREYSKRAQGWFALLRLSCGCELERPAGRVPKGDSIYCKKCRDKLTASAPQRKGQRRQKRSGTKR